MENQVITKGDIVEALKKGEFNHQEKVQLFALFIAYLDAGSIQYVADNLKISYNGVKKSRQIIDIGGLKIAIPNENEVNEI